MNSLRNKFLNSWPLLVICFVGYAVGLGTHERSTTAFFVGLAIGAFVTASTLPRPVYDHLSLLYGALVDVLNVYYERHATGRLERMSEGDAAVLVESAQKTVYEFQEHVKKAPEDLQTRVFFSTKWEPSGMKVTKAV